MKSRSNQSAIRRLLMMSALLLAAAATAPAQSGSAIFVSSGGQNFESYLAAPGASGRKPAIVLLHSNRGLEQGYRDFTDRLAAEGYVTLAVGWQSQGDRPSDDTVEQLVRDAVSILRSRADVDATAIGLTGFCAGGRYTMLLLPQIKEFAAGVAWYGFPNTGSPAPVSLVDDLSAPIAIMHGSADRASPIAMIYDYAQELDAADKYYELKVYQGEPHRFMVPGDRVADTPAARDAFASMLSFWERMF